MAAGRGDHACRGGAVVGGAQAASRPSLSSSANFAASRGAFAALLGDQPIAIGRRAGRGFARTPGHGQSGGTEGGDDERGGDEHGVTLHGALWRAEDAATAGGNAAHPGGLTGTRWPDQPFMFASPGLAPVGSPRSPLVLRLDLAAMAAPSGNRHLAPGRGSMLTRMAVALARMFSILAHPLPILAFALLAVAMLRGAGDDALREVAAGFVLTAGAVMGYSWWRVRRGDWRHVDASAGNERRQLNGVLLAVLPAAALAAGASGARPLAWQLGLAALPVALAMASARWCTLSLHVAFAIYAALLLAPVSPPTSAVLLLVAAGVAWSRLRLARHAPRDIAAGAAAGTLAGVAAWAATSGAAGDHVAMLKASAVPTLASMPAATGRSGMRATWCSTPMTRGCCSSTSARCPWGFLTLGRPRVRPHCRGCRSASRCGSRWTPSVPNRSQRRCLARTPMSRRGCCRRNSTKTVRALTAATLKARHPGGGWTTNGAAEFDQF